MKSTVKKKTYNLDAEMIDRVRRLYLAKTDTEAIQKALQKVIEDHEIQQALDKMIREGHFRTVYK
ncbi:MAG TPA: hypothetical protein VJH87_20980 [Vicinamibacteria bacterium]|nr:hypothetical protein [Vicinamibacteria bacterium]